ncbi:cell division protein SepF [Agilicoccus flavus]|uniref:cell division protein SepF n=1 Tax=Agilicoccus flavus TaxID=2775968 RepID=UPI001CF61263|nr:cell division protein SepF [Agilicoccus flavus]
MAGALRKTMVYLGLAEEDDRYERYDDEESDARDRHVASTSTATQRDRVEPIVRSEPRTERIVREEPAPEARHDGEPAPAKVRGGAHVARVAPAREDEAPARRAEVTPLPRRTPVAEVVDDVEVTGVHRITTIHPRTYNEAKNIGESFRDGTPVIMNLSDLDDADAKRLVDFAAGLVFGLQGTIERVTSKVFLLSPADVEVTSHGNDPKNTGRGLFNQS